MFYDQIANSALRVLTDGSIANPLQKEMSPCSKLRFSGPHRVSEVRCPHSAPIPSGEPTLTDELWYMSRAAGVHSGSEVQQYKKELCQFAHIKSQVPGSSKMTNIV